MRDVEVPDWETRRKQERAREKRITKIAWVILFFLVLSILLIP